MLIRLHEVQRLLARHRLVSVAVGAALLLFVAVAVSALREPRNPFPAVLVQNVGYEAGEAAALTLQTASEEGLVTTEASVRAGTSAGAATLPADAPSLGELRYRSEWQSPIRASKGDEYWYGVSFYLPADWDQGSNPKTFDDRIIFQFHEGVGEPVFSLHLRATDERILLRRKIAAGSFTYLWSTGLETGRWYDFAFGVRWSDSADGRFDVYEGGRRQAEYSGPTVVDGTRVYTKWGIYGQPTHVLFDEVRIAHGLYGLALVSPQGIAHAQRKERK